MELTMEEIRERIILMLHSTKSWEEFITVWRSFNPVLDDLYETHVVGHEPGSKVA